MIPPAFDRRRRLCVPCAVGNHENCQGVVYVSVDGHEGRRCDTAVREEREAA